MTSIASYIRNEFVRRFPDAAIDVTFCDDETISVRVSSRIEPALAVTYVCDVSSDDDVFSFVNDDDAEPVVFPVPDDIV